MGWWLRIYRGQGDLQREVGDGDVCRIQYREGEQDSRLFSRDGG